MNRLFFILLVVFSTTTYAQLNNLSDSSKVEIKQATEKRLGDLGDYLALMASKEVPSEKKESAMNSAQALFVDDHRTIQVSSKKRKEKISLKTIDYFKRIRALQYDKVTIKWTDIYIADHLFKGPDDKYYGNAYIIQEFTGAFNDFSSYQDVTKKTFEIVVEKLIKDQEEIWEVRLGNVMVAETK